MERNYKFAVEDIQKINLSEYEDDEFAVARMGFLSTRPNSHGLIISEEVLRQSAPSVLNKWLVADMTNVIDAGTHSSKEKIVGRIPKEQEVEFVYDDNDYLRAYVDVVVSKIYAADFCELFETDNNRAVSVEMLTYSSDEDENVVESFRIVGVTVLGRAIKPSCPQSDIEFTRFSADDADAFFAKVYNNNLTTVQQFVNKRKELMADKKTYKIDKSKEAVSDTPWSSVDKTKLRNAVMEAANRATLVKSVYLLVEDGWEDAPSEHLKFPVMQLKGDTFVYNSNALSSALGYAKKENETSVVSKVEKIQKKLGLDSDEKEDKTKMAKEIKFAAVDIGDLWGKLYHAVHDKDTAYEYCIYGIYEEDNKKFVILTDRAGDKYRLDFSLTEEGLTLADQIVKVQQEFVETETMYKFAEPENVEQYKTFADDDDDDDDDNDEDDKDDEDKVEMSVEEMADKIAELEANISDRDNIIMEKDQKMSEMETELAELRAFKEGVEKKEQVMSVDAVMAEVKDCLSDDKFNEFRDKGLAYNFSELDAWKNEVKAFAFENSKNAPKKTVRASVWSFAAPITTETRKSNSLWK